MKNKLFSFVVIVLVVIAGVLSYKFFGGESKLRSDTEETNSGITKTSVLTPKETYLQFLSDLMVAKDKQDVQKIIKAYYAESSIDWAEEDYFSTLSTYPNVSNWVEEYVHALYPSPSDVTTIDSELAGDNLVTLTVTTVCPLDAETGLSGSEKYLYMCTEQRTNMINEGGRWRITKF